MPELIITPQFVKEAIQSRHPNSKICEGFARDIEVHAKGETPEKLINKRRPSEPEATKKYRYEIYVSKTKNPITKVINSLSKIRRSQDWSIQYVPDSVPATVSESETLEKYCEKNYPGFTSITNWAFSELLKRYLIDANSVVAVIINKLPSSFGDYLEPIAEIFSSKQIINYVPDEWYVLQSSDVSVYSAGNGRRYDGKVYWVLTKTQIQRYEQINGSGDLTLTLTYAHNFDEIPITKTGGIYFDRKNNDIIYESRIASMVPDLNEAAREYSDLQAEIVQHIHSEKYMFTNTECPSCKGVGSVLVKNKKTPCDKCSGVGSITSVSSYGTYLFNTARTGEQQIPGLPVGYIDKSTEIAKLQAERVKGHIYDALSSLNMEFLAETPLNQSGTAKEVDQDELNNFVNSVAEDIVRVLDSIYYFICQYRYSIIVPDQEKRNAMLPTIPVPEKYGLLNSKYLMEEISTAKSANANPVLVKNMEIEYARKKYNADPDIAYELEAIFALDPFYGYSQDEKMVMLSNGGITEEDYIVSCNIAQFIHRAIEEKEDFYSLKYSDKQKLIAGYAQEVIALNSEKEKIRIELESELLTKQKNQLENPEDGKKPV